MRLATTTRRTIVAGAVATLALLLPPSSATSKATGPVAVCGHLKVEGENQTPFLDYCEIEDCDGVGHGDDPTIVVSLSYTVCVTVE